MINTISYQADGVEEPFRMYTGSWRTPTTMKYFGLSESVIKSDVGYVLVKLLKPRATNKVNKSVYIALRL